MTNEEKKMNGGGSSALHEELARAIEQSRAGEVEDLGSFAVFSDEVISPEEREILEVDLQESGEDASMVRTSDGRSWLIYTAGCGEVWARSYRFPDEGPGQCHMLAEDLPLPLTVLYRARKHYV